MSPTNPPSSLLNLYPQRGLTFVRGSGPFLYSADGRAYLDLSSQYGAASLGYGHPGWSIHIAQAATTLPLLHGSFDSAVRQEAAAALCQRFGPEPHQVFLCNSGTEAVEAALKFAVLHTGRKRIVACHGGYHGRTLGALSATAAAPYRDPFLPLLWEFEHVPYGDTLALERALRTPSAAFIVEPIQGEAGIIEPPPAYLANAVALCRQSDTLLILDEIQSGCGRSGTFLAAEQAGIQGDITCLGKGLAGGLPVGATVMTAAVAASIPRGSHGTTFGGNPLVCSGIQYMLDWLTEERLATIQRLGTRFRAHLEGLDSALISAVRGRGLMLGIAVTHKRDTLLKGLQGRGILAIPAGRDVVRFLPPYVIDETHLIQAFSALERTVQAVHAAA